MSYKTELQSNNADLQAILAKVNALPEAGSGEVVEPVIEELAITENGTYTAPDGVDGYSPVTVDVPIPDGYVKPSGILSITDNGEYDVTEKAGVVVAVEAPTPTMQSKTVTPNANGQTVTPDSGYDGLSSVVVKGDANLVPENIVIGKSIFGVSGSAGNSGGAIETVIGTIKTIIAGLDERPLYYLDKNLIIQCVDAFTVSSIEAVKNSIIFVPGGCTGDNNLIPIDYINEKYEVVRAGYATGDFVLYVSE